MGVGVVVFLLPCLLLLVPFGIGRDCARDESFSIICDETVGNTSRPFWRDMEISRIQPAVQGEIVVFLDAYRICFNKSIKEVNTTIGTPTNLSGSPFSFSSRNTYVVTGCATTAYMTDSTRDIFTGACTSVCQKLCIVPNNTCSRGIGCCENFIMDGLQYFHVEFHTYYNRTNVNFNPCSHAFLVEDGMFDFNQSIITADQDFTMKLPVVIDWAIETPGVLNQRCETAMKNLTSYA